MSIDTKSSHVTPVGGNVFADLGFDPKEAQALKAASERIISEKLAIKTALMTELALWIESKELKQAQELLFAWQTLSAGLRDLRKENAELEIKLMLAKQALS